MIDNKNIIEFLNYNINVATLNINRERIANNSVKENWWSAQRMAYRKIKLYILNENDDEFVECFCTNEGNKEPNGDCVVCEGDGLIPRKHKDMLNRLINGGGEN